MRPDEGIIKQDKVHAVKIKKSLSNAPGDLILMIRCRQLFLVISTFEFFHPAGCIHKDLLSCVERMRRRAYFYLDQRIFLSIFPLDFLIGGHCGSCQKLKVALRILEDNFLIFGMYPFLHYYFLEMSPQR